MPQVPYNPVPTAQPSGQATPELRVNASPDAFGVNIGEAIKQLGGTAQNVGDELFQRGLALQKLQNETLAVQADTDFTMKAGQAYEKFKSLEGQNAVSAYESYQKELQSLREGIRSGLGTDESRRMYDGRSLTTFTRLNLYGAAHSGSEQKKWSEGEAKASIAAAQDSMAIAPKDEVGAKYNEDLISDRVQDQADLLGWGPEKTEEEIKHAISSGQAKRLIALAKISPVSAREMFDKLKPNMTKDDVFQVDQVIEQRVLNTGTGLIAAEILKPLYNPDRSPDAKEAPLSELVDKARKMAEKQFPNNPLAVETATQAVETGFNRHKQIVNNEQYQAKESVGNAVLGLTNKEGILPTNLDELQDVDPDAAEAFDKLKAADKARVMASLARNAKGDVAETPERRERYNQLRGMALSFPAEFKSQNIWDEDIPIQMKQQLQGLKEKIAKGQETAMTRQVGDAMRQLEPSLRPVGITTQNKDQYNSFKGALWGAMEGYRDTYGKPPNPDEVKKIGAQLLRDTNPGWVFSGDKQFEVAVPEQAAKAIREDKTWAARGVTPDDAMVKQIYYRGLYNQLYQKGKGISDIKSK